MPITRSPLRRPILRLHITWLTLVTLMTMSLVISLGSGDVGRHFSPTLATLQTTLNYPFQFDQFNSFRASLEADMLFLIAYGLLLRRTAQYRSEDGAAQKAALLTWGLMLADATENLTTLRLLSLLEQGHKESRLVVLMNAASVVKWVLAGAVMLLIARGWRTPPIAFKGSGRNLARVISALFTIGGLASILTSAGYAIRLPGWIAGVALLGPAGALLLQAVALGMPALILRFLFLARVPLLSLFVMAAFGAIAAGPAKSAFGGILEIESGRALVWITASSLVVAFAAGTQMNLIRAYSSIRTGDRTLRRLHRAALDDLVFWTSCVAAMSVPATIAFFAVAIPVRTSLWAIPVGMVIAFVLFYAVEIIAAWLSEHASGTPIPHVALSAQVPLASTALQTVRRAPVPGLISTVKRLVRRAVRRIVGEPRAPGYVETLPNGTRRLLPGHIFALTLATATLVFYAGLIYAKQPGEPGSSTDPRVPTLVAVLLLVLLLSWVFSSLAFFLDRYRVPLVAAVLALTALTGTASRTDHVFLVDDEHGSYHPPTPAQVLGAFPRPILIAAAGGGIQAGAWTTRVLEGIDASLTEGLRGQVALVSAVSGGSMGAYYYGAFHEYPTLAEATRLSQEASLDEIASALVGADALRVLGFSFGLDRGSALERTWKLRAPQESGDITLKSWAERAGQQGTSGKRFPAFLFNTTVVETGQPAAFATSQMPSVSYRRRVRERPLNPSPLVENASVIYGLAAENAETTADVGLRVATVARLSAAFPYVSPAATPSRITSRRFHMVDGGYYDNYGLVGLAQWLDDALEEIHDESARHTISIVVIRGALDGRPTDAPAWGWRRQISAPPSAFLATRSYGQWAGGSEALKLLQDKWNSYGVALNVTLFDYPLNELRLEHPVCAEPPLSWKLTREQQKCLDVAWAMRKDRVPAIRR